VTDKNLLTGQSKLESLGSVISNLYHCYESRGVILRHRGAQGILSNANKDALGSTVAMLPEDRDKLHEEFKAMYGTLRGQSQVIITSQALTWKSIEHDPRKLGLFEETREDLNRILDAFGIPADLFVRPKGSTYENQRQAEKRLYENTVIPETVEWTMGLNQGLMKDDPAKIIADYSHIPSLQEDLKVRAEGISKTVDYLSRLLADEAITIEEYRHELAKLGIGNGQSSQSTNSKERNGFKLNGHATEYA
jgi:phage portal protein BeeE